MTFRRKKKQNDKGFVVRNFNKEFEKSLYEEGSTTNFLATVIYIAALYMMFFTDELCAVGITIIIAMFVFDIVRKF